MLPNLSIAAHSIKNGLRDFLLDNEDIGLNTLKLGALTGSLAGISYGVLTGQQAIVGLLLAVAGTSGGIAASFLPALGLDSLRDKYSEQDVKDFLIQKHFGDEEEFEDFKDFLRNYNASMGEESSKLDDMELLHEQERFEKEVDEFISNKKAQVNVKYKI